MICTALTFADLAGWAEDDHQAAMDVFLQTSTALPDVDWAGLAAKCHDPRQFFETNFQPTLISDAASMLFTGYFEPELPGAMQSGGAFQYPIYAAPPNLVAGQPWLTRQQIEETDALAGHEIVWLANQVDRFFLHVQGSGRINLPDGRTIRVGYAARNGHPYVSIGAELVRRGLFSATQVSARTIRDWIAANPDHGQALLWTNSSYIFFREVTEVPATDGPIGTLGRSVTPLRSIAVDPAFTPLGLPVWIEKAGEIPMNRLMIAQDTGSAIKGAQRADIFFGTGDQAGESAGQTKDGGRMVVMMPREAA